MTNEHCQPDEYPSVSESPSGLIVQVNATAPSAVWITRTSSSTCSRQRGGGRPGELYLRRLGEAVEAIPLLGPRSPAEVRCDSQGLTLTGAWQGIRFTVSLVLAKSAPAWFWHVALENIAMPPHAGPDLCAGPRSRHYGAVRLNEYYVSQYLDHTRWPPEQVGCWPRAESVHGRPQPLVPGRRPGGGRQLRDRCLAGPWPGHPSWLDARGPGDRASWRTPPARAWDGAIQTRRCSLRRASVRCEGSLAGSRRIIPRQPVPPIWPGSSGSSPCRRRLRPHCRSWTGCSRREPVQQRTASAVPGPDPGRDRRPVRDPPAGGGTGGRPSLSFFLGERSHVALKAKELEVLRPHGQILRTGGGLTPTRRP